MLQVWTTDMQACRAQARGMPNEEEQMVPSNYQITVQGHLNTHWEAWFDDLTITNQPNGEAVLSGTLADQAALHGLLNKIRDLGLPLMAVAQVTTDPGLPDVAPGANP